MLVVSSTPVPLKKQFPLVRDTYKIVIRLFELAKTYSNIHPSPIIQKTGGGVLGSLYNMVFILNFMNNICIHNSPHS